MQPLQVGARDVAGALGAEPRDDVIFEVVLIELSGARLALGADFLAHELIGELLDRRRRALLVTLGSGIAAERDHAGQALRLAARLLRGKVIGRRQRHAPHGGAAAAAGAEFVGPRSGAGRRHADAELGHHRVVFDVGFAARRERGDRGLGQLARHRTSDRLVT